MTMAPKPLAQLLASAGAPPAPAGSIPCPPPATAATAAVALPPRNLAPPLPPDSPDDVTLTPAETLLALDKAKRAKHSDLFRAYRTWEVLHCDLVACDFEGGLGYVERPGNTTPAPYYPASAADVELAPAEIKAALAAAQVVKWGNLKFAYHSYQAQHAPKHAPMVGVTFETVRSWALRQAQVVADRRLPAFDFVLDQHNRRLFELLCYYYAGDKQFEILGEAWGFGPLKLDKGNAIFGGVGRGKTILQEVFRQNPRRPYGLVSARKVSDVFTEDMTANDGKRPIESAAQKLYRGKGDTRALCFDDVAREETKHQYMGNWVYPMQRVILDRYDAIQRGHLPLWATHLTSNNPLDPDEHSIKAGMPSLTELYSEPAIDRLYEMCNILTLDGPSRRA
jgi:hypothetical protein